MDRLIVKDEKGTVLLDCEYALVKSELTTDRVEQPSMGPTRRFAPGETTITITVHSPVIRRQDGATDGPPRAITGTMFFNPGPDCPDCGGTRIYQPLAGPAEPCRTCCGEGS